MIQDSPILSAIGKGLAGRVLGELEKLADKDAEAYGKIWDTFGAVPEGRHLRRLLERRDTLLGPLPLQGRRPRAAPRAALKEYVASLKENQNRHLLPHGR